MIKPLDAKVQVHRLAKSYMESNLPFQTSEEKKKRNRILQEIKNILEQVEFKNEIDRADFKDYLKNQINEKFELPEPVRITGQRIRDELVNDLERNSERPIAQIQQVRDRKQVIEQEIHELQNKKKHYELIKKKDKLKAEVELMEKKILEDEKEENYLTEKKDKDGIVKLRTEKFNKRMDELKFEQQELQTMLEKETDEDKIKIIKEAIKHTKQKITKLHTVKIQTKFQNYMVKIPRWINSGTKAIGEISDGLSSLGGEMGKAGGQSNDDPFDLSATGKKKGKKGKDKKNKTVSDFGFNEKSTFDI